MEERLLQHGTEEEAVSEAADRLHAPETAVAQHALRALRRRSAVLRGEGGFPAALELLGAQRSRVAGPREVTQPPVGRIIGRRASHGTGCGWTGWTGWIGWIG